MPAKRTKESIIKQLEDRNKDISPVFPYGDWEYENIHQYIEWICEHNHIWKAPINRILQKKGCNICAMKNVGLKNVKNIDSLHKKIELRNKEYPNKKVYLKDPSKYKGMTKKCTWICSEKHEWNAIPKTIVNGSYCPECRRLENIIRHTDTHQSVLKKLEKRNIKLPNKKVYLHKNEVYKSKKTLLNFTCDNGHIWKSLTDYVINGEAGCPICAQSTYSIKAINWLDDISKNENIFIQHAKNKGEYKIPGTKYRVDGFCTETNTVYEFYGDYWHGNPNTTVSTDINYHAKMSFKELYDKTKKRENNIKKLGYNITTIWESEYDGVIDEHIKFKNIIKNECFPTHEIEYNSNIISSYPISIYIPSLKFGIMFCSFKSFQEQNTDIKYLNKQIADEACSKNISVIHIFEDEWKNNKELVISKLKHYSQQSDTQKIYARKCDVKQISKTQKGDFLNKYHIQGNDNSTIFYGAYFGDVLVSVMTFTKPRVAVGANKNNINGSYELARFTTHTDFHVVGIASKLLTAFERDYTPTEIYSFADKRWSVGNLYEKIGFKCDRINHPDYFYIVDGKRMHRWNFRKDAIKEKFDNYDPNKTEYELMLDYGYDRVWGVGTIKYIKTFQP